MIYRRFGRTNWKISEIGYGMWGMAGWSGSDLKEVEKALDLSIELGCNFFDTAYAYANGKSEQLLGALIKLHSNKLIYAATKIPPKNQEWPAKSSFLLRDVFPKEHIIKYTEKSLKNLGLESIPLQQFHVWDDSWSNSDEWKEAIYELKKSGKIQAFGLSLNRWEPANGLNAIKTGLIDSIQVIYNIFDQNPEDELFPLCKLHDVGLIARVPFDEGTLTGTFTVDTVFPDGDWRSKYFVPENLLPSVAHADALKPLIPSNSSMADMALRFILENEMISTTIPGMRSCKHVKANLSNSDGIKMSEILHKELKMHRWDRIPTEWSM
jgi:aryl-alcohol dehydrogenase-like predicted oxidoreductase